jgi:hypothetical protein
MATPEEVEKKVKARIEQKRALQARLRSEGERELASKLGECGEPITLTCICCKSQHTGRQRCKQKWCPRCCYAIATDRNVRMRGLVETFRWPLFVTLTMANANYDKPETVRVLRRAFGKLRHQKFWKKNVVGGLACIEVTDIGNGLHFHLHAVLDCQWLAIKTPRPQKGESKESMRAKFKAAAMELERAWAKILKQPTASVKVKRCSASTITKEVIKYAMKGSELLSMQRPIGPLIRALQGTRLMTTFGSVFGSKVEEPESDGCELENPFKCCSDPQWRPGAAGLVQSWGYEDRVKEGQALRWFPREECGCGKCSIQEKLELAENGKAATPGGADLAASARWNGARPSQSGPAAGRFECQRS